MEGREERFCDVGRGISLCYDEFGDPNDPPLLLVMGLATQMIAWHEDFCEGLAERGFHVVRFDNRDIGRSTHMDFRPPTPGQMLRRSSVPGQYTLSDMAQDTAGLIGELGPRAGPRRRRLDGRHDRPDAGRRAPRAGALADLDHVHHGQPLARPALAQRLSLPVAPATDRPPGLHRSRHRDLRDRRVDGIRERPQAPPRVHRAQLRPRPQHRRRRTPAGSDHRLGRPHPSARRDRGADPGHPRHRGQADPPLGRQGHGAGDPRARS